MRRSPVSRSEATAGGDQGSFFRSNRVRARARKEGRDCRLRSRRVVRATPFAAANESTTTTRIEDPPPKKSNTERAAKAIAMMMIVGRTSFSFSFSLGRKVRESFFFFCTF